MKKSEIIARAASVCRTRHLSIHTERSYVAQIARFFAFCATRPALVTAEDRVRAWLEDMAPHVAAKTQAQALNAIVFLYRDVLEKPLGELGAWSNADRWKLRSKTYPGIARAMADQWALYLISRKTFKINI